MPPVRTDDGARVRCFPVLAPMPFPSTFPGSGDSKRRPFGLKHPFDFPAGTWEEVRFNVAGSAGRYRVDKARCTCTREDQACLAPLAATYFVTSRPARTPGRLPRSLVVVEQCVGMPEPPALMWKRCRETEVMSAFFAYFLGEIWGAGTVIWVASSASPSTQPSVSSLCARPRPSTHRSESHSIGSSPEPMPRLSATDPLTGSFWRTGPHERQNAA